MTTTRTTRIWCDSPGCKAYVDIPVDQLGDARRIAKLDDWKSAGSYDVCPIGWWWQHEEIGIVGVSQPD